MKFTPLIALGFLSQHILGNTFRLAKRLPQPALDRRQSFYGGWALSATTCPEGLVTCESNHACCPKGTVCDIRSLLGAVACCPDENRCSSTIVALPICAEPGWTLFKGPRNPFCCIGEEVGVLPKGLENGICAQKGVSVPKSVLASRIEVSQGTNAPNPAATVSGGSSAESTSGSGSGSGSNSGMGSGSGDSNGSGSGSSQDSENDDKKKSGLSGGAIGGIVGGAIAGIALIIGAFFLGRRRASSKSRFHQQPYDAPPPPPPAAATPMQQQQHQTPSPAPYYNAPPPQGAYSPNTHSQTPVGVSEAYPTNKDNVNVQQTKYQELSNQGQNDKWVQPNAQEMPPDSRRYLSEPVRHEMQ